MPKIKKRAPTRQAKNATRPARKAKRAGAPRATVRDHARAGTGRTARAARNDAPAAADDNAALAPDDRVIASNLTLHELFAQQTTRMLEHADLSEEQKQSLLIGMSCPCCGAGGFSFTAKLKRGP